MVETTKKPGALKKGLRSWKTTTAGIIAALMLALPQFQLMLDEDPATNADWGIVIAALMAAIGGVFARDGDKSSEDVGTK